MLKYVIGRGVIVYEGETDEQAFARHERMVAHNEAVVRQLANIRNPSKCPGCGYPAGWHTRACTAHLRNEGRTND